MNDTLYFRQINEIEKEIIFASFYSISPDFSKIIKDFKNDLYILTERSSSKNKFPRSNS